MTVNAAALATPALSPADRAFRRALLTRLDALDGGLVIEDADGRNVLGHAAAPVRIAVNHPRFYRRTIALGSVGAAESYVDGDWDCDDLVGLVRLLVVNRALTERLEGGLARIGAIAARLVHRLLRDNSESGSRTTTSVPLPSVERMRMRPPCNSTSDLEMASPRPQPIWARDLLF